MAINGFKLFQNNDPQELENSVNAWLLASGKDVTILRVLQTQGQTSGSTNNKNNAIVLSIFFERKRHK